MTSYLIKNCHSLAAFDALVDQKKEPQLSVWRGKTLVIVSFKANSIGERITLLAKKIFYFIFQGFLSNDVEPLKGKVLKYYAEQGARYDESLKTRVETLEKQIQCQTTNLDKNRKKLETLTASVKKIYAEEKGLVELRDTKQEAEESLKETLAKTEKLNGEKQALTSEIETLTKQLGPLKTQVGDYERALATNENLRREIMRLRTASRELPPAGAIDRSRAPVAISVAANHVQAVEARLQSQIKRLQEENQTLIERNKALMDRIS